MWRLGGQIARCPLVFVAATVICICLGCLACVLKFPNLSIVNPFTTYFSPLDSKVQSQNRDLDWSHFTFNLSHPRYTMINRFSNVDFEILLKTVDENANILREEFLDDYLTLKRLVERLSVLDGDQLSKNYSNLQRFQADNSSQNIVELNLSSNEDFRFKYPYMVIGQDNNTLHYTGDTFGGVKLGKNSEVEKAQALSLKFKLKQALKSSQITKRIINDWAREFNKLMQKEQGRSGHYNVLYWSWVEFEGAVKGLFKHLLFYSVIPLMVSLVLIVGTSLKICGLRCNIWVAMGPLVCLAAILTVLSASASTTGIDGYVNAATYPVLHFMFGNILINH